MTNENKLKTLKDLKEKPQGHIKYILEGKEYVEIDNLKAEAIKRVKFMHKNNECLDEYDWMEFFNITEEDLQ